MSKKKNSRSQSGHDGNMDSLKGQLMQMEARKDTWKRQSQKLYDSLGTEKHRKRLWQMACVGLTLVCVVILTVNLTLALSGGNSAPQDRREPYQAGEKPRRMSSHPIPKSLSDAPLIAHASVRLGSGSCSGTVFWKDDDKELAYILSARHCVWSEGDQIQVHFVDGDSSNARVLAVGPEYDLSLLVTHSTHVVSVCEPADSLPSNGTWTACGYPGGVGPKYKTLQSPRFQSNVHTDNGVFDRNVFRISSGPFSGGDSGGGVAVNNRLAGVMTHGGRPGEMLAAPYQDIRRFLSQHGGKIRGCDPSECPWLQPNVPLPDQPGNGIDKDQFKQEILQEVRLIIQQEIGNVPQPDLQGLEDDILNEVEEKVADHDHPHEHDFPEPERGPEGPRGPAGPQGPPGEPGTVDYSKVSDMIDQALAQRSLTVVYEGGDEPDEQERRAQVSLDNGEIFIPSQQMRVRNVDAQGNQKGPAFMDKAPLGSPLKYRFKFPIEASQ